MNRLAVTFAAALSLISVSAMALTNAPVDERINRSKPTLPARVIQAQDEVEEFDPSAPDAMDTLRAFDQAYRAETGEDTLSDALYYPQVLESLVGGCTRAACPIWVNVVKNERPQMLYLYVDGRPAGSWKVSTAAPGHVTPNFEGHPAGPFYPGKYTSKKYPGGDYRGLGNMPYAMFYKGGFALHGTPSIGQLGRPASHGCVRMHPDNAHMLNQMFRSAGAANIYISVSGNRLSPEAPAQMMSSN